MSRRTWGAIVGIGAIAGVGAIAIGCGGLIERVKYRASHEFRCPIEQVVVKDIGTSAYMARGCGYEAVYVCGQANAEGDIGCVRQR